MESLQPYVFIGPAYVNYAHLSFGTWQNGLSKYILDTTGDTLHAGAQYPLVRQTSQKGKKKKQQSVSLLFGSGCAVTDEVSVSVKPSPHTPTVAQALKFIPAI